MENEKIIKPEYKEEVVRIFRKLTASGVLDSDKAITKIIRDNPHFFHQPTEAELKKIAHSEMNDAMRRRAQQTNRLSDDIFREPADNQKPS
jgi:fructose-1-phosphate kinase PfkB-like protein